MTAKDGGFYSAEDADSLIEHGKPEHAEGAFYVWTKAEIDDAARRGSRRAFSTASTAWRAGRQRAGGQRSARRIHGQEHAHRAPDRRGCGEVFQQDRSGNRGVARGVAEEALRRARETPAPASRRQDHHRLERPDDLRLRPRRAGARRPRLSRRRARLRELHPRAICGRTARSSAATARARARSPASPTTTRRSSRACSIFTRRTSTSAWLQWAVELQTKQDALFGDPEHGGYFSVAAGDPNILLRMKEDHDGAEPSPNSVAALNLLRLAQITDDRDSRERAEKTIAAFADQLARMPSTPCRRCSARSTPRSPSRARSSSPASPTPPTPARCCAKSHARYIPKQTRPPRRRRRRPAMARREAGVPPHGRPDRRQSRRLRVRKFRLPAPDDRPGETARTAREIKSRFSS